MTSSSAPRVTFGVIVLNGEPFTRYCLRSLYPFAHQIVVVEGGHEDTRAVTTPDGHSTDGTLDVLERFKAEEDPLGKVEIVTRDGFWPKSMPGQTGGHRTPQSRAYAERASGDYLWQVDIDEFYRPQDMALVLDMLRADPSIATVSFDLRAFWGGLDYEIDGWKWRRGGRRVHRLFRWSEGYEYVTHEQPTVVDERGRDLRKLNWVKSDVMTRRGIFMYHYAQLFPAQVWQKALIYRDEKPEECAEMIEWAQESYFTLGHPFHVERHYWDPSWLVRYRGAHPPEAVRMVDDVRAGRIDGELRRSDDVERLLDSRWYRAACAGLATVEPVDLAARWTWTQAVRATHIPRRLRRMYRERPR